MVCRGVYRPCCHRDGEALQPLVALGNGNVSALNGQGIVGVDGVISGVELVGACLRIHIAQGDVFIVLTLDAVLPRGDGEGACPNTHPVVGGKAVAGSSDGVGAAGDSQLIFAHNAVAAWGLHSEGAGAV